MKIYYKRSFYGYNILSECMHPLMNRYVEASDFDTLKFEVKRRFNREDLEFIEGEDWLLA